MLLWNSRLNRYITNRKSKKLRTRQKAARRVLLPMAFLPRSCGQEYYSVRLVDDPQGGRRHLEPRELNDLFSQG